MMRTGSVISVFTIVVLAVFVVSCVAPFQEGDECVIDLTSCSESQKAAAWQGQSSLDGTIIFAFYLDKSGLMCSASTVTQSWPVVPEESWWCGVVKVKAVPKCVFEPTVIAWSDSEFRLTWQADSTEVEAYNIERSPREPGPYEFLAAITVEGLSPGINSFSFSDESVEVGQFGAKYCYRIQAQFSDHTLGCITEPVCTELVIQ